MADLNLIPNPSLMVSQACLLVVNLFIAKKLFIGPYLELRERRESATTGSAKEAQDFLTEAELKSQVIAERLQQSRHEAFEITALRRNEAEGEGDKILRHAKDHSQKYQKTMLARLQERFDEQKDSIATVSGEIATSLLSKMHL